MRARFISGVTSCVCLLVLFGLASGCKKGEGPAQVPPSVEVVEVAESDVPVYRELVGTLESEVNASIAAQVSGYLLSRNYREGSMVTNGQVLFQIDPAPFKAALDQAKSQLAECKATEEKYALGESLPAVGGEGGNQPARTRRRGPE